MTHGSQELRFRPASRFCGFLCFAQIRIPHFDLFQHAVECIDQRADFIIAVRIETYGKILLQCSFLHGFCHIGNGRGYETV